MAKKSSQKSTSNTAIPRVVVDSDSSVQVRKIMNGFIVSENGTTGKGRNQQYYNKEYFSKTNPLKIGGSGSSNGGMKFGGKK